MEEIFIAIMERIAGMMPELSCIDEDYGQLEAGAEEDQYPVTFPCVLIGNTESDWNDLGYGVQKSESLITIRLAVDCYDDTHYTSGTYQKAKERLLKAKEPHRVTFHWVKGHAGHPQNERCDTLATAAADSGNLIADEGDV